MSLVFQKLVTVSQLHEQFHCLAQYLLNAYCMASIEALQIDLEISEHDIRAFSKSAYWVL